MRKLLAVVLRGASALAVLSGMAGCATAVDRSGTTADTSDVDVHNAAALKAVIDVEASLPIDAEKAVTVSYERKPEYKQVPYLAVQLVSDAAKAGATSLQTVHVTGTFPGKTPTVFVVDSSFNVVAMSDSAILQADGSSTTTVYTPRQDGLSVVVHDPQWSAPMSFSVSVVAP